MKFFKSLLCLSLFLLVGCSTQETAKEPVRILVPQGATAMSLLPIYNGEGYDVKTVSGSDVITAEMSNPSPTYDMIIAPVNLGAKLIEKGNTDYKLDSIVTWGNLYVVGNGQVGEFAAFGENAVPQKILTTVMPDIQATYYNSVQDVQAQILSGNVSNGLMAEPAATATIAKAKEQGIELTSTDLQALYQEKTGSDVAGYPQAAIFVKQGSEEKVTNALTEIEKFLNETAINTPDEIVNIIEEKNLVETIGIPNAQIAQKTWTRQNLKYVKAKDAQDEITQFLKLFEITYKEDMIIK